MSMLKIISENNATGYEIIKKVNELTGEKPSTGSVYPLLNSMANKGWIAGKKRVTGKTIYKITDSGKKVVQAHDKFNKGLSTLRKSADLIFLGTRHFQRPASGSLELIDATLFNAVANELSSLLAHGIAPEKINIVLLNTLSSPLQRLE